MSKINKNSKKGIVRRARFEPMLVAYAHGYELADIAAAASPPVSVAFLERFIDDHVRKMFTRFHGEWDGASLRRPHKTGAARSFLNLLEARGAARGIPRGDLAIHLRLPSREAELYGKEPRSAGTEEHTSKIESDTERHAGDTVDLTPLQSDLTMELEVYEARLYVETLRAALEGALAVLDAGLRGGTKLRPA